MLPIYIYYINTFFNLLHALKPLNVLKSNVKIECGISAVDNQGCYNTSLAVIL